ncbi:MAG: SHOCT domain-containing protein [Chloroflexi bacterium]|nr:SHOCT domain-containing protein [Chloroflexota bacterium]
MMLGYDGLGLLGPGLMILFWVGIVVLLVWAIGASVSSRGGAIARETSALEILQQRYARGKISKEEFETARRALS